MSSRSSPRPVLRGLALMFSALTLSVGTTVVSAQEGDPCSDWGLSPPYAPVPYEDMPGYDTSITYANLPYQGSEDNVMYCNTPMGYLFNLTKFRYYHYHQSELFPTKVLPRGTGPIKTIPKVKNYKSHEKRIQSLPDFTQNYDDLNTDALLVIHKGKIYYEKYTLPDHEMQPHLQWSMTKSYVGIIAAMLAAEGIFDPEKKVSHYLPELADPINSNVTKEGLKDNSHYKEMTVRHLMDMSSDTSFNEYPDSKDLISSGLVYSQTMKDYGIGFRNTPLLYGKSTDNEPQGTRFDYKSLETLILGMVLESSKVLNGNGKLWEYFYEHIWSKLGQEGPANIIVDWQKHPSYFGGSSVILRDAARFGLMMLNGGKNMDGNQIVPKEVVRDIANGGTELNKEQMRRSIKYGDYNEAYRNQFWVTEAGRTFAQFGIHGQACFIDTKLDLVIVKQASDENDESNSGLLLGTISSYFEKSGGGKKDKRNKAVKGKGNIETKVEVDSLELIA